LEELLNYSIVLLETKKVESDVFLQVKKDKLLEPLKNLHVRNIFSRYQEYFTFKFTPYFYKELQFGLLSQENYNIFKKKTLKNNLFSKHYVSSICNTISNLKKEKKND